MALGLRSVAAYVMVASVSAAPSCASLQYSRKGLNIPEPSVSVDHVLRWKVCFVAEVASVQPSTEVLESAPGRPAVMSVPMTDCDFINFRISVFTSATFASMSPSATEAASYAVCMAAMFVSKVAVQVGLPLSYAAF